MKQKDNILKPILVGNLLKQNDKEPEYRFFIPAYQRGYRWETDQVEDLLDDLFEFITNSHSKNQKYCLQPIVVKKMLDGRFEVLDGQQRLTTIFILLARLKINNNEIDNFSLEYETRPNSAQFLKNLNGLLNDENPDYFFISNAYKVIDEWLKNTKNVKANIATSLFDAIVESIEFIWYEILDNTDAANTEDTSDTLDAIDVFTRINIGKIPLTNAELVKAVFLSKNNLSLGFANADSNEKEFNKILSLKQNAIALEWDNMEKTLQDDRLWGFIYSGQNEYETRLDYLLDLMSQKLDTDTNLYHSFRHFYEKVKAARSNKSLLNDFAERNTSFIENEWSEIKSMYDILNEWFQNKEYNHLIGFLISQNSKSNNLNELIDCFKTNNRNTFIIEIKNRIKEFVKCDSISKLRYPGDNRKIERILLLHNVIGSLAINDINIRFPFEKLKNKKWTLEHIFAQNSDYLKEDDYIKFLRDHLRVFEKKCNDKIALKIIAKIKTQLAKSEKIDKDDFNTLFSEISSYIQKVIDEINDVIKKENAETEEENDNTEVDYGWINDDNCLANLALLDGSINSSLSNSLFDIKRELIIKKDKDGLFVPNQTKSIFMKYYTSSPNHLAYWTYEDREAYIKNIKDTLTEYLN